ncbi:F0F1 ATP synthase subunit delta [Microlunatus parietis]|uniref:ATP synthase subunit delta n=1 Tax=Microlunatus parietis TaxID=682979 RepID=A0A7Y9IEP8_9ACTN|nr:F0F1 ATP synthase subunit delta [Microlunatus parietis]NYE75400.1 F-type H+-transporting ATPase subunit delta [Microlunatus parietis]
MSSAAEDRLSALDSSLDSILASGSGSEQGQAGSDLFAVVDALDAQPALRRALTDPGTPEEARAGIARSLFEGKIAPAAVELLVAAVRFRWSGGRTFTVALERQAVRAQLRSIGSAGLEETEDELFRFGRLVDSDGALRSTLSDRSAPLGRRQDLVSELLSGKANDATIALARRAVAARQRTFANTIAGYVSLAAAERSRLLATVRVARPLEPGQLERLQQALSRQAGREISVQVIVDAELLGGIRVELGDEVIEGTVAGRLDQARRLFE